MKNAIFSLKFSNKYLRENFENNRANKQDKPGNSIHFYNNFHLCKIQNQDKINYRN